MRLVDSLNNVFATKWKYLLTYFQKYKDPNALAEMNSLKYAQKMIDLRLSFMQNNKRETDRDNNSMANLPIIPLDELLNKQLTLSFYLDYLSVLNLQRYVIFYISARGAFSKFNILV